MKDIYPHATKLETFRWKLNWYGERTLLVLFIISIGVGIGYAVSEGRRASASTVSFIDREIIKEVVVDAVSPVMERIAKCESGGTHTRNGQVIFNANTNKSVDIGYFLINSIWSKKATEMGLDLTKEEDNKKFGMYLYKHFGTEPWYSSKACWNK